MRVENSKTGKKSNDELLAELRGLDNPLEPKISSAQEAKIRARIARELNDYHKPIFISINNK
ncbi:MAG: hypothetical protein Q7T59_04500 [Candidatus Woesebacteria bacterium]|jgi:hypothetical protein|nr:hypothetical protein [Candidatus Woesebacteria bacterium]